VRRIAVLDAPSNLGLRPPTATSVPGCAKAPGALRDQGLLTRLGARDAGCLTPPRYDPGDWRPGDGVAHAAEIAAYSRALADRIGVIIDGGEFPVVLGGDCSILIGAGIAMHRLGDAVGGRIGLVFVDGHSDFRHPGNASYVGAAAGEDLALVTGRGQADLAAIESRRPYFRDIDVVVLGIRAQDEYRLDLQAAGIVTRPVPALRAEGAARSAQWARDQLVDCAGYWVHVDVDVLDPAVMPAVDAPDPGGIAFPELELLLSNLVESPHCLGVEITVFDPDYDPDGRYASEITSAVVSGLSPVRTTSPRPDLVAARRDFDKPAARRNAGRPAGVFRSMDTTFGDRTFATAARAVGPDPHATSPDHDDAADDPGSGVATAPALDHGDAVTTPGHGDAGIAPGHGDAGTVPGHGDAVTIPGHGNAGTASGHGDAGTAPGHGDAVTIPGHGDAGSTHGHGDGGTYPGHGDAAADLGSGVAGVDPDSGVAGIASGPGGVDATSDLVVAGAALSSGSVGTASDLEATGDVSRSDDGGVTSELGVAAAASDFGDTAAGDSGSGDVAAAGAPGSAFSATDTDLDTFAADMRATPAGSPVRTISIEIQRPDSPHVPETGADAADLVVRDHGHDSAVADEAVSEPDAVPDRGAVSVAAGADAAVSELGAIRGSGATWVVAGADAAVSELSAVTDSGGVPADAAVSRPDAAADGGAVPADADAGVSESGVESDRLGPSADQRRDVGVDGGGADLSGPGPVDPESGTATVTDTPGRRAEPAAPSLTAAVSGETRPAAGGFPSFTRSDADFVLAVALATGHAPMPSAAALAARRAPVPAGGDEAGAVVPRQFAGPTNDVAAESVDGVTETRTATTEAEDITGRPDQGVSDGDGEEAPTGTGRPDLVALGLTDDVLDDAQNVAESDMPVTAESDDDASRPGDETIPGPDTGSDAPADQGPDAPSARAVDGAADVPADGAMDVSADGVVDGAADVSADGVVDGAADGSADGAADGSADAPADGVAEVPADGAEPDPVGEESGPATESDGEPRPGRSRAEPEVAGGRLLSRLLGSAPLLDSEPLPATRPGMLRPRPPADGGFGPPAADAGPLTGLPPGAA
jgi:arginase family enzyme